jgi:hypothetical protein
LNRLEPPANSRQSDLFRQLNQRYFNFARQLPDPLKQLGRSRSTFLGSACDEAFEGVQELNPVLAGTPWLFWETFSSLDDECFLQIAEAGTVFVLASIVLDHLVDGQAEEQEQMALFHQALYSHGISIYRAVFGASSDFWVYFERLASDHLAGLAKELQAQLDPQNLSLEDLNTMAHGKVSPIVVTIAALSEASRQPEKLGPIETSLKHISVASQLLDDIGDWKHDLEVGHVTYYLTRLAPTGSSGSVGLPSVEVAQSKIDAEWIDVNHLEMVLDLLDDSTYAVRGIECPAWIDYVGGYHWLANEHLTTAMARHLVQKLRPLIKREEPDEQGETVDT